MSDSPRWFKSGYSSAEAGCCFEVAFHRSDILVRDSAHKGQGRLVFAAGEWHTFIMMARKRSVPATFE